MIDLGKWPTMRVVGRNVTPDQAGDILICTAPWFQTFPKATGWERESREIAAEFGMPLQPVYEHGGDHSKWFRATWDSWVPSFNDWRRKADRVLLHGHYSVPHYYGSAFLVGYRPGRFELPATIPPYYDVHNWAMSTWWASPSNR